MKDKSTVCFLSLLPEVKVLFRSVPVASGPGKAGIRTKTGKLGEKN